jgi:hypothetical protein
MQREKVFTKVATVKHRLQMQFVDCFAQAYSATSFSFIPQCAGPAVLYYTGTAYKMLKTKVVR